jgi:hypothetical protein
MVKLPRKEYRQLDLFSLTCLVALVEEGRVSMAANRMGHQSARDEPDIVEIADGFGGSHPCPGGAGMLATSRGVEFAQAAQNSIDIVESGFWKRGAVRAERRGSLPLWLPTMSKRCFFQP